MSVLAVSDLVFGDLLTELDLKPWWEKIRGYCFATSVVSSLFMMYITLSTMPIDCIPEGAENATTRKTISTTEARFINNHCFNQLPLRVSIYGFSPLCFSIFILLASSIWTLFPDVASSFRKFAQFEKIIAKLNSNSNQICDMSSKIINEKSSKECKQVRKACSLLWKYESQIVVERFYWIRNWILILLTVVILAISGKMLHLLFVERTNFRCSLDLDKEYECGISIIIRQTICSHSSTKNLQLFMVAFTISMFAQGVFTAIGIIKFWPKNTRTETKFLKRRTANALFLSESGKLAAQYSLFMIKFWKNVKHSSWDDLEQIVYHIFYESITKMNNNLEKATSEDVEMVKLYCSLKGDGGRDAFTVIYREIRKKKSSAIGKQHDNIVQFIGYLKPMLSEEEVFAFVEYLREKRYWELLANVMVAKHVDWIDYLNSKKNRTIFININEIGQPYCLERSILFYFLSGKPQTSDGAQILIEWLNFEGYVHFDGKSMNVKDFLNEKMIRPSVPAVQNRSVIQCIGCSIFRLRNASHSQIKDLCKNHIERTNDFKEKFTFQLDQTHRESVRSEYSHYLETLSEKLSRYKFDKWEVNTKSLAEYANSEEQWVLLVALLNTFIVEEDPACYYSSQKNIFTSNTTKIYAVASCGVNEFALKFEEKETVTPLSSILYYALRKPPYLKHFHFTAIRHILDCTRGQEKNVRKNDGTIVSAIDYVTENENLDFDEKEVLIQLLGDSMKPQQTFDQAQWKEPVQLCTDTHDRRSGMDNDDGSTLPFKTTRV